MPFTPYHFGPALFVGVALFPFIDIVAILVSSVVLDIEPFIVLLLGLHAPLHGLSHTYLVATLAAFIVTCFLWTLRDPISQLAHAFNVAQEFSARRILLSSLFGTYSHVLMDSFIYPEMNPFFPFMGNPLLGVIATAAIYQLCLYSGILGALIYIARFCILHKESEIEDLFL